MPLEAEGAVLNGRRTALVLVVEKCSHCPRPEEKKFARRVCVPWCNRPRRTVERGSIPASPVASMALMPGHASCASRPEPLLAWRKHSAAGVEFTIRGATCVPSRGPACLWVPHTRPHVAAQPHNGLHLRPLGHEPCILGKVHAHSAANALQAKQDTATQRMGWSVREDEHQECRSCL